MRASTVSAIENQENPHGAQYDVESWQEAIRPLAAQVAAVRLKTANYSPGIIDAAIQQTVEHPKGFTLVTDILLTLLELGERFDEGKLYVREVVVPEIHFDDPGASQFRTPCTDEDDTL